MVRLYLCIQTIEGSQLCLVVFVLPNIKRQKERKEFFDEEGGKVFVSKNCWNKYLARRLLLAKPAKRFSNPARKSASCQIEKFPGNREKNLLDLAAKQLKWQHCFACRGRLRNVLADCCTLCLHCVTVTRQ